MYALLDWDGTMRKGATIDSWCAFLREQGVVGDGYQKERNELIAQFKSGVLSHDEMAKETNQAYLRAIAGMDEEVYKTLGAKFRKIDRGPDVPLAKSVSRWLRHHHADGIVISGSPLRLISPYFTEMGILEGRGLLEEIKNGKLTGRACQDGGHQKDILVQEYMRRFGGPPDLAAGDSTSDIPMLDAARIRLVAGNSKELRRRYPNAVFAEEEMETESISRALESKAWKENR